MASKNSIGERLPISSTLSVVIRETLRWLSERPPAAAEPLFCKKCGDVTQFKEVSSLPMGAGITIVMRTHAEKEKWAWYCPNCNSVACGQCTFPQWQALKAKEGLTGPQLAEKLEREPGALFFELPTCPLCGGDTISKYDSMSLRERLAKRLRQRRESTA